MSPMRLPHSFPTKQIPTKDGLLSVFKSSQKEPFYPPLTFPPRARGALLISLSEKVSANVLHLHLN